MGEWDGYSGYTEKHHSEEVGVETEITDVNTVLTDFLLHMRSEVVVGSL